jgi:hypothetical protein
MDLGEFPALEETVPIAEVKYADNTHVQCYCILLHVEYWLDYWPGACA